MIRSLGALILLMMLSFPAQAGQPTIVTSIHPLALVVKELVGDDARVSALIPANVSPHHYSMKPSERRRLQNAHRFIWLGPAKEPFLEGTLDDPDLERRSLALDRGDATAAHNHDTAQEDPHIWLNPDEVRAMLPPIVDSLAQLEGLRRPQLEENRQQFLERLAAAEDRIRKRLDKLPAMDVFTYHGAFHHFAEHFDIRIAGTLTANPEQNPGARHLAELQDKLNNARSPCIMTEPQFSRNWWEGLNIDQPMSVSHWDPMGTEVEIRQGGYTRFLDQLADALVNCGP
ncbi:zinc transport system substrate-binding protein [Halospina denitrificans]|uniref:High-affinity zinc uptake system protein ZnuA n=1 Tax=Halospina denitrificans TaxID=332522 RepID=A0A4R7JML8_9GAMM|nr:zinc ABC transporter substrate-binding protein [Halospina denitrificans]TDT39341.1 zinc transport system substrate-binding protein [Halospina denitrificans]